MKKYDNYKSTKIVWYPEIPKHWNYCKVKHLANTFAGGTPSTVVNSYWEGGEIPWLPSGKLQNCEIISAEKFITEDGLNNSSTKWIKPNTVLIALTGATCANIGYLKFDACANQSVVAIDETTNKANSRFLYYMFLSMRSQILTHQTGGAQAGINDGDVKNLYLLKPSIEEQTSIASFLDYKTSLIDTTIEKKKRLIELLKEKRQAVINEAVTKGLNPNAPMKDSGVEWLGEIPQHWKIIKLKHIVEMRSGNFISAEIIEQEGDYPVYGGNGLRGFTSEYTHEGYFPLIGRQGALCGNINYASGKFWATEHAVVVSSVKEINSYWIGELLRLMNLNQYSQASAQPGLSVEKILNLRIPFPTFQEQNLIAHKIENLNSKIELSELHLKTSIEKLQTYRQSLISEAVTGKIDVRDWERNKIIK
jgi:type I restriction enzyme S subunit